VEADNGNLTVVEAGENVLERHVVQIGDDGQDVSKFEVDGQSSSGVGM